MKLFGSESVNMEDQLNTKINEQGVVVSFVKLADGKFTYAVTFEKGTTHRRNASFETFDETMSKARSLLTQYESKRKAFGSKSNVFPWQDSKGNKLFTQVHEYADI